MYKDSILEQYDGDIEKFLLDIGDATRVSAIICKKFKAVELYGIRELMVHRDYKRLDEYERNWNMLHRCAAEDEGAVQSASSPVDPLVGVRDVSSRVPI